MPDTKLTREEVENKVLTALTENVDEPFLIGPDTYKQLQNLMPVIYDIGLAAIGEDDKKPDHWTLRYRLAWDIHRNGLRAQQRATLAELCGKK